MKKNNIILIGFMGVGKGTVARAMVKEAEEDGKLEEVGINSHFRKEEKLEEVGLKSHFREDGKFEEVRLKSHFREEEAGINSHFQYAIDTDDLIESMENRAIKKIFAVDGEAYFRNLEKKTALWLESSVDNTIISTGGGFYRQENLKNIGTVIYLKSSFDGILKRIKKAPNAKNKLKKRPLLQNKKEAMKLYDTRVKEYERVADIIVDVENRDLEFIVKEILGQIK